MPRARRKLEIPQGNSDLYGEHYQILEERKGQVRSEYLDGDIVAVSGGSREHNLIVSNILPELSVQLRGRPCEVYPSEMRIKVSATGRKIPSLVELSLFPSANMPSNSMCAGPMGRACDRKLATRLSNSKLTSIEGSLKLADIYERVEIR